MVIPEHHLLIFAKEPLLGRVKTRLANEIGAEKALCVYSILLDHTLGQARRVPVTRILYATPDESIQQGAAWAPGCSHYAPQGEGDLGVRLSHAFASSFQSGASKVVVIGTDCPGITSDHLNAAFNQLEMVDAVVGPSFDGGYWLLGLRKSIPEIFANIAWSTASVLAMTTGILNTAGFSYISLEKLRDVDTLDDLRRVKHFKPFQPLEPHLE